MTTAQTPNTQPPSEAVGLRRHDGSVAQVPEWMRGPFAPVQDEVTFSDLPVQGAIPTALNGSLLRNGPNPSGEIEPGAHWFTGDGMLHGIRIAGGKARWYRNRWVRTRQLAAERGEGPPPSMDDGDSPANTHVLRHAGRIFALCEAGLPYQVTPELDTAGMYDFNGKLQGAMTAHPKVDAATGELILFGYSWHQPYLRYHVADKDGVLQHSVEIAVKGPTMMHDCAITATRTLFLDLPVCFDMALVQQTYMPYRFSPDYGARIGIVPRYGQSADVRWFEIEPCYIFHAFNAWDDGPDRVVLDGLRYDRVFVWSEEHHGFLDDPLPSYWRYTFNLAANSVKAEQIHDVAAEFPRIDDRLAGKPARYGYAARTFLDDRYGAGFRDLLKFDRTTGAVEVYQNAPNDMVSEPVFAPAGPGEDHGYILSVVYSAERDKSNMEILDATSFTGRPVATIELPIRVPMGFHGNWLPDA